MPENENRTQNTASAKSRKTGCTLRVSGSARIPAFTECRKYFSIDFLNIFIRRKKISASSILSYAKPLVFFSTIGKSCRPRKRDGFLTQFFYHLAKGARKLFICFQGRRCKNDFFLSQCVAERWCGNLDGRVYKVIFHWYFKPCYTKKK